MMLQSCHIDGFGTLTNLDVSFDRGLTVICRANGTGKSTLAAFIRVMLYGISGSGRLSDVTADDRRHYAPWNGGRFGGSLTVTAKNGVYRIERVFGTHSKTGDRMTVFDTRTGEKTDALGDVPGITLFGVDEPSFRRTVFMAPEIKDSATAGDLTADIGKRLNCLTDGTTDNNDYQTAHEALEKARKYYKPSKGKGGALYDRQQEIDKLDAQIRDGEAQLAMLADAYGQNRTLAAEIRTLAARVETAETARARYGEWLTDREFLAEETKRREALSAIEAQFPAGLPTDEVLTAYTRDTQTVTSLAAVQAGSLSDDETNRLTVLRERFAGGLPDASALTAAQTDLRALHEATALRMEAERQRSAAESVLAGDHHFAGGVPDATAIATLTRQARTWEEKTAALTVLDSTPPLVSTRHTALTGILAVAAAAVMALVGVTVLTVGVLMGSTVAAVIGGAFLVGGVLTAVICRFARTKENSTVRAAEITRADQRAHITADIAVAADTMRHTLSAYGYDAETNDLAETVRLLTADLTAYQAKRATADSAAQSAEAARRREESSRAALSRLLGAGADGGREQEAYEELLDALRSYESLTARYRAISQARERADATVSAALARMKETRMAYGADTDEANTEGIMHFAERMRAARRAMDVAKTELADATARRAAYRAGKQISDSEPVSVDDPVTLRARLEEQRAVQATVLRTIRDLEAHTEGLVALREQKTALETALESDTKTYGLLKTAMEMLEDAEQTMIDRYRLPVETAFLGYYRSVADNAPAAVCGIPELDSALSLKIRVGGATYAREYMSDGWQAVCRLCMRLALCSRIFGSETPFLILDDPFVSLDEQAIEAAGAALKTLSSGGQILYFCCHPSRTLNVPQSAYIRLTHKG